MTQSKGYVDPQYLAAVAERLKDAKERSYSLMHVQTGQRVLDVGCGPGTDTLPLAHLVGSTGEVVGVDTDADMIAQANLSAASAGVASWVTHQQADTMALPFETASFDACRCERMLQHVMHPDQAVSEMVRVTKPDGWVVAGEPDWGTHSISTSEVDIERRLARVHAERCIRNGYIGRQLYSMFTQQQLREISVSLETLFLTQYAVARNLFLLDCREREAVVAGLVTEDDLQRWRASLEQAEAGGVFFGSMCGVMVAGRRR